MRSLLSFLVVLIVGMPRRMVMAVFGPLAVVLPVAHDGIISSLRAYSPSALRALGEQVDPPVDVHLRGGLLSPQVAVFRRR